jgi:transposase
MSKKRRRSFTKQQKADAVKLVRQDGNLSKVARNLGLWPSVLRNWVQQADIDEGKNPEGALTSAEREELNQLRRENRTLAMERDFLKKAAAFFARETDQRSR